jgi:membrane fusion protein (multidrug efflux system)
MIKRLTASLAGVALITGGFYGYHVYEARYPATDNAYITANVVHVAPQVSGRVQQVAVGNQQYVHNGELLYWIDPKPFELAVDHARAHLQQTRQNVARDAAAVASARAEVQRLEVLLQNATRRAERSAELKGNNYVSKQSAEDLEAEKLAAAAALDVARAKLNEARERLGQPGDANQAVQAAKAELDEAQWQLDNTRLNATCDGRIAQLSLQPGDAVQSGQSSFVLICDDKFWVAANFKETELERIRPGQPVAIAVDMYPDIDFSGTVVSINGASGVAFSLLPPQNASGNWVKVTQRVPVKILVDKPDPQHPLLVGTSAQVRVDTTTDRRT